MASPWAHDGKIYALDASGTTFVVKAGPEYQLLSRNELGEMCWSTPVTAQNRLFIRTVSHLYCIN